ncbi:MAG: lysophospholipid acyltransferase family protein, partial [Burkholderiales bacterium]
MMTRAGLGLIWLLHWLPLSLLAPLGRTAGLLLYALAAERRRVVLTNLRLCFPELREQQRVQLARNHFAVFTRSLLEHGILWWGSRERVLRMVRIEGLEHWRAVRDRPVIWLSPHFVGLDMGGIRLTAEFPLVSVYSKQKNPAFDAVLYHGR